MDDTRQRGGRLASALWFIVLAAMVLWFMVHGSPFSVTEESGAMDQTRQHSVGMGDITQRSVGIGDTTQRGGGHAGTLWFIFLAGPVLWIVDLMLGYIIAAIGCDANYGGATLLVHLLTLVCAVGTAFAGYVAVKRWRRSRVDEMTVAGGGGGSQPFMELAGILMSAYFLLLILGEDIALFVLKPCQSIT